MRLGIDLDGVVFPFAENFRNYCWQVGAFIPENATIDKWDFFLDWGMSVQEFVRLCNEGVDEGYIFMREDPYPDAVETLRELMDEGHTVHIITHRMFGNNNKSMCNTALWLAEHDVPFTSVTFAEDKTFAQMDVLLDDRVENYWASVNAGIPALLFDRPWNEHDKDASRVFGWQEFAKWVDESVWHEELSDAS